MSELLVTLRKGATRDRVEESMAWLEPDIAAEADDSSANDIPRSSPPENSEQDRSASGPQQAPLAKLMVVDDERSIVHIIHVNFEMRGFEVHDCIDSSEALDMAREVRPDVIILDLLMPKKSGWEVLAELKGGEETWDIPVVILSVMTRPEVQEQVRELGATGCVAKPFDMMKLISEVSEAVGLK